MTNLTPVEKPLPCYSLEYNSADPRCKICPHAEGCIKHSGSRAKRIPLSQIQWKLTPESYAQVYDFDLEDPELPHIQRTYFNCYEAIFGKQPADDITRFAREVIDHARQADCALQMYLLSNMVGHRESQKIRLRNTEKAYATPFHAKMLLGKTALTRAKNYGEMCNREFGTFKLSSLGALTGVDFEADSLQQAMLHSEVVAGRFIVSFKIANGGPPWRQLFNAHELTLDPHWLAIEEVYTRCILDPYLKKRIGAEAIKQHRFFVSKVLGHLKKHSTAAMNAFYCRETIMPQAVSEVLGYFGLRAEHFLIEPEPITQPLEFWVYLGRAVQHFHCLLYLDGEPSFFSKR